MRFPALWGYRPARGPLQLWVRLLRLGRFRLSVRVL
jgi:hypothetical protein